MDTLYDPTLDTVLVHYESLATNLDSTVARLLQHIPELESLDPQRAIEGKGTNWCESAGNAGRCESVVQYFKENPLAWRWDFVLDEENKARSVSSHTHTFFFVFFYFFSAQLKAQPR